MCSAVDNGMSSDFNSMQVCFDGYWRSPACSGLPSVSDVIEKKLSSESIKVARNSFHFPQTSFTNSFLITVWFIVSV